MPEGLNLEYSYIFGLLPLFEFSFWGYVYLIIGVIILNFILAVKVTAATAPKARKFYIVAGISFLALIIFGFVGWVLFVLLTVISYALVSEFYKDY
jgi:hypothetical protein